MLAWHRALARHKWTFASHNKGGRPRADQALEGLILRLAKENPRWGYGKIEGELRKLGCEASQTTIRDILKRHTSNRYPFAMAPLAGVTANPTQAWVTQQARQILWNLDEPHPPLRFLIRDNDGKFSDAFETVFISKGYHVLPIPFRAPNANAYAERWVRVPPERSASIVSSSSMMPICSGY